MGITGSRIRELRLRQGLTLDDVAKHLGVGRQAIYKYEQGTVTNIPLENIEKMAALFGTTPGYIAGWIDKDSSASDEEYIINTFRVLPQAGKKYLLQQVQIASITFGEKPQDVSDEAVR